LALDYVRERFVHGLADDTAAQLNLGMEDLHVAIGEGDLAEASEIAGQMREQVEGL
jgi:hypothetical protein